MKQKLNLKLSSLSTWSGNYTIQKIICLSFSIKERRWKSHRVNSNFTTFRNHSRKLLDLFSAPSKFDSILPKSVPHLSKSHKDLLIKRVPVYSRQESCSHKMPESWWKHLPKKSRSLNFHYETLAVLLVWYSGSADCIIASWKGVLSGLNEHEARSRQTIPVFFWPLFGAKSRENVLLMPIVRE